MSETDTDTETLHPHLLWVQDDSYVHVTIDCETTGVCSFNVDRSLYIRALSRDDKTYLVNFPLFGSIIKEECQFQWTQRQIYLTLRKAESVEWTFLTTDHEKWKTWIRTDWKEWESTNNDSDFSDDEDIPDSAPPIEIESAVEGEGDLSDLLASEDVLETVKTELSSQDQNTTVLTTEEENLLEDALVNLL